MGLRPIHRTQVNDAGVKRVMIFKKRATSREMKETEGIEMDRKTSQTWRSAGGLFAPTRSKSLVFFYLLEKNCFIDLIVDGLLASTRPTEAEKITKKCVERFPVRPASPRVSQ